MDITEMISKLTKAQEDNKLVVFVGAGVSRNSHLPAWQELVQKMDMKLGNTVDPNRNYSNDELLRIPQYLSVEKPDVYDAIIKETYGKWPESTNPIIDNILELNPHHIITTNFDFLIECSIEKMRRDSYVEGHHKPRYARIHKDDDLIGVGQGQLFIKMHGDTEVPESIVLKEDDYLDYSQSHIFIETIIKSLLIDHTFLFIGYGIGDYNLKLIMNWVDSLVRKYPNSHSLRRPHFFFHPGGEPLHQHEITYYDKKNIKVIDANAFPGHIRGLEISAFDNDRGNNCVRLIEYIKRGPYQEESIEFLEEKLSAFKSQDMILYEDLAKVLQFGFTRICPKIGSDLYYQDVQEWFKAFPFLLAIANGEVDLGETHYLKSILEKCGIRKILVRDGELFDKETKTTPTIDSTSGLEQVAKYKPIIEFDFAYFRKLSEKENVPAQLRLFALVFCGDLERSKQLLDEVAENPPYQDYIQQTIFLLNAAQNWESQTMPVYQIIEHLSENEKNYMTPLCELISGSQEFQSDFSLAMQKIKQKYSIENYRILSEMSSIGYPNYEFQSLRTRLWDRVNYFAANGIYTFGCMRTSSYQGNLSSIVSAYIDTLLFLQSPFCAKEKYAGISIEKMDIFLLLAYCKREDFSLLCSMYDIESLSYSDADFKYIITVLNNVINEQRSCIQKDEFAHFYLSQVAEMCISLLSLYKLSISQVGSLIEPLGDILMLSTEKYGDSGESPLGSSINKAFTLYKTTILKFGTYPSVLQNTEKLLLKIIKHFNSENHNEIFSRLHHKFLEPYWFIFNLCEVLYRYSVEIEDSSVDAFVKICLEYPYYSSYTLLCIYPICNELNKKLITDWARQNINHMSAADIYHILFFHILDQVEVQERLLTLCQDFYGRDHHDSIKHSWESPLYVLLRLYEKDCLVDISPYKPCKDNLPLFSFICFPEEFDYALFDIGWYSWLDLPRYKEIAMGKAYDTLKLKFDKAFAEGMTTKCKRVYYRLFYVPEVD